MDRARAKNHQIGQYLDDNAASFISDVAKKGPGVHDVPLPINKNGRGYLPNGVEVKPDMARVVVKPDMARVVVKPDGSIRISFPYNSSPPN
ncbi:hypothetical protein K151_2099 [Proteus hauseri ZMd44]|nr:hypothetical protein K151_2099 [Proteus hauseri ZMd44]